MKPKSLSASSAKVFELCPARWVAEYHHRAPQSSNSAATLGSAVHEALEEWAVTGNMTDASATKDQLLKSYDAHHHRLFGDDVTRLDEGKKMLADWYDRTHPIKHEILSVEVKENFPITVNRDDGKFTIPFNYIWDRCDRLPNGDIDVVDYKTIAMPLNAEQMRETLQVRCYAVAAMSKYPDAQRIWVTYDMLRHGDPLGVSFTRDECVATYRYLQGLLHRILDTDANNAPETVNAECRWCVRKQVCKALQKHSDVGGVHGITDPVEAANKRLKMDYAAKALKVAIEELDAVILQHMEREDILEFETDETRVEVNARKRRSVDADRIKAVLPEEIWEQYGKANLTMGDFDKLLKDERLDAETKSAVKQFVSVSFSSPSVFTKPVKGDE